MLCCVISMGCICCIGRSISNINSSISSGGGVGGGGGGSGSNSIMIDSYDYL